MIKLSKDIKIGCDPEFFLIDEQGEPQSAIGLIGGSKENPTSIGRDCYIQEDNVAVEFNVPPCDNSKDLGEYIRYTVDFIEGLIYILHLKPHIVPSCHFKEDQLLHPMAKAFGCTPDYCAWNDGEMNDSPEPPESLRTAAGHIHISFPEADMKEETNKMEFKMAFIKALDLFLGVPSVVFDTDTERRSVYGKAGCFRDKMWGLEYRVLSNFWIRDQSAIEWVYENVQRAYNFTKEGNRITPDIGSRIIWAINGNDIDLANKLINEFNLSKICAASLDTVLK